MLTSLLLHTRRWQHHDFLGTLRSLLLLAYLGVYLVGGDLVTSQAWKSGQHLTPEQWLEHERLSALGFVHHHGQAVEAPSPQADLTIELSMPSLSPDFSSILAPAAGGLFGSDWPMVYLLAGLLQLGYCASRLRPNATANREPTGVIGEPPDRPPRYAR